MKEMQDPIDFLSTPQRGSRLSVRFRRFMDRVRALLSLPDVLDAWLSRLHGELDRRLDQSRAELKAELSTQLGFSLHDFEAVLSEQKEGLMTVQNDLRSQLEGVQNTLFETTNRLVNLDTSLHSRLNTLENEQLPSIAADIHQRMQAEAIPNELRSLLESMRSTESETTNRLIHLDTSLHSRLNTLENERLPSIADLRSLLESMRNTEFETTNRLIHLDTSLHSRLNTLENERLLSITEDIHQLTALHFALRASMSERRSVRMPESGEPYQRSDPQPFEAVLERARRDFPRVFPLWFERLEAMERAFHETKIGNAAHAGDSASRVFRSFVELNACGRLLDLGCGIFGLPYYLASYPAKLVSGIDPLQPTAAMGFEFVRGISEYLPWPDESFSTVVSATSLDHGLSLEKSLAEIRRVLRPGGCFLLWIGSVPGAPQYHPHSENFVPADRFHLFHFDVSWFEPLFEAAFDLTERVELRRKDYSHVIYSLVKK
jgi:SAM-dependent methyltransferase